MLCCACAHTHTPTPPVHSPLLNRLQFLRQPSVQIDPPLRSRRPVLRRYSAGGGHAVEPERRSPSREIRRDDEPLELRSLGAAGAAAALQLFKDETGRNGVVELEPLEDVPLGERLVVPSSLAVRLDEFSEWVGEASGVE